MNLLITALCSFVGMCSDIHIHFQYNVKSLCEHKGGRKQVKDLVKYVFKDNGTYLSLGSLANG